MPVPTKVERVSCVPMMFPLTPKSPSFTRPLAPTRMFEGLMSLWTTLVALCRCSRPLKTW